MKTFTKKFLTIVMLFCMAQVAMADRGVGKKSKNKTILNIYTPSTLRSSIVFNLKSGLSYKGSLLNSSEIVANSIVSNSLITYQKGNVTYIIPYKNKIVVPEIKQGYTGIKFIIRPY